MSQRRRRWVKRVRVVKYKRETSRPEMEPSDGIAPFSVVEDWQTRGRQRKAHMNEDRVMRDIQSLGKSL